ncbi:TPA: MFS transporter [Salmonella enterica subsp. enterica serovar Concord]|uniref:MFS transporter n=1 Tax=Citrobacter werkmanii TaxID=67827 RepID=UPI0033002F58|nr:MFS transporter [Salmonella enterica subsp. enterica serovar Concord]
MTEPWYKQVTGSQRKALLSAWLGYVFDGFDFMLIFYILHLIKADLGISDIEATMIGTVAFLARPVGGAFFGAMADKFGRKPVMMWAIVVYSVGTGLSGFATGIYTLAVCRFIVGLGMSGEYACASTYAVESWPRQLQSKASAFLVSGFSIGNIIAAQVVPYFSESWGWRNSFFIGLLPVLLVLYIRRTAPESQEWMDSKMTRDKGSSTSFLDVFRKNQLPVSLTVLLACFSLFGANWPINGLLPTYLANHGAHTSDISNLMTIAGLGTLSGTVIFGFIGDKIGLKKTFICGLVVSFLFLCPLFFIPVENHALMALCLFGLMFTNLGIAGLVPKFIYNYFPTHLRGMGTGLIYNLGATGGMVAPVIATYISGMYGLGVSLFIVTLFFSLVLIFVIGGDIPDKVYQWSKK